MTTDETGQALEIRAFKQNIKKIVLF